MKSYPTILVIIMCILVFPSCFKKKTAPEEVLKSYEQLKSELDEDTLGESIEKLEAF
ncbi:MAG: hypothetical protein AB1393_04400 [Candidatus Edwardsbacteria bacterium]